MSLGQKYWKSHGFLVKNEFFLFLQKKFSLKDISKIFFTKMISVKSSTNLVRKKGF